ncbi:MAG: zf-TFIIB domain-containing protein [candidate division Zixibacteria bacterium]|nr:zf-TFIIB domain-containing protein [candidate division Zixibacteria bacterium]
MLTGGRNVAIVAVKPSYTEIRMNCVACNEPMVVLELQEVEIDHCLACGGIWLDAGEIELLVDSKLEAGRLLEELSERRNRQPGKRKCPICLKKMEIIMIGPKDKVQIDHCRKNHGLWFDRGELETVLKIFDTDDHSAVHGLLKSMFGK